VNFTQHYLRVYNGGDFPVEITTVGKIILTNAAKGSGNYGSTWRKQIHSDLLNYILN